MSAAGPTLRRPLVFGIDAMVLGSGTRVTRIAPLAA
jgi:hypothetical protein